MKHAKPMAGLLALVAALAAGGALAGQDDTASPPKKHPGRSPQSKEAQGRTQQLKEQPERTPQAQEEQAGNAARQPQRKPGEQPVKGQPQGQPDEASQSQKTRSGKPPPPRRRVPANVATMPEPAAPQAYGPVLHDMAPQTTMPTPAPPGLPNPAPINNCTGGQCRDTSGNTYNTGVGNAAISSDGRLCNRSGNTVQCF